MLNHSQVSCWNSLLIQRLQLWVKVLLGVIPAEITRRVDVLLSELCPGAEVEGRKKEANTY